MKRIVVSIWLVMLTSASFAQIYVRANVGYNLPMNSSLIGVEEHYDNVSDEYRLTGVYGSYGTGFSANIAFGGGFKSGIVGYDIEVGYLMGKTHKTEEVYESTNYNANNQFTRKAKSIQIAPSITFTGGTGNFHPFARMGPVIALTTVVEHADYDNTYSNQWTQEYKYSGGISLGFKGVLGIGYSLNESLDLFTELDFIAMAYSPKKREITEYTVMGEDRRDQLPEEILEEDIEDEVVVEGEGSTPPMKEPLSMGSIGLQFGVKFKF
jgi:hypothetical protein